MDNRELVDAAWAEILTSTISGAEWQKRVTYGYKGKPYNWQNTAYGRAKLLLDQVVDVPADQRVIPPQPPITTVTNAPTIGLNVTTTQHPHDYVIDGTGDTAALFHQNAHGSSLKRAQLKRVAALNAVGYGKHGIYGKARNLLVEDLTCECSPYAASGVSFRYDGAVMRRFNISGASHALSYYETSLVAGTVLFEDGECSFIGDTGVWVAPETDYTSRVVQAFTFRRVNMTGSGAFMKVQSGAFGGASVRAEGCKLNGVPVTASAFPNVPNLTIV